ncbi:MAG: phosphoribosyltransferase family protein [Candidatus Eisenbacteria bacterium]
MSNEAGSLRRALLGAHRAALSFLFPDSCLACGVALSGDERHICSACRRAVVARPGVVRLPRESPVERVCYSLEFDGPVRALVRALKYDGRTSAARDLAAAALPLAREVAAGSVDLVVPVPLHSTRRRERGFNQAELIAVSMARGLGLPTLPGLSRTRATSSQVDLTGAARLANVSGAFAGGPALLGRRVLVVDDVVTTGATLCEACAAALRAGAERASGLAVAGRRLTETG